MNYTTSSQSESPNWEFLMILVTWNTTVDDIVTLSLILELSKLYSL